MILRNEIFEVSAIYWLVVLALSLSVFSSYLWRLAFGKLDGPGPWQQTTAFAAAVVLCLTAIDGLNFTLQELSRNLHVFGSVAVIAITAALSWLHLSHWMMPRSLFRRHPAGWSIMLSSLLLVGWSFFRFHERLDPPSRTTTLVLTTPKHKQIVHEFLAITDRNRSIPVYRMADVESDSNDESGEVLFRTSEVVIQRSPASPLANCHGWVFLDAQFLISGEAVQQILDDNEYEIASEPKAGDVIVYRDDNRNIVHTGLVRGVLNDDTVIIESKWATEGVFLHDPEGTPYSSIFEYYRSPRSGNRVKVVHADEAPIDD